MALSTTDTPKNNGATQKVFDILTTPGLNQVTPKTRFTTSKNNLVTPDLKPVEYSSNTLSCYKSISSGTPVLKRHRRNKYDEVSNLTVAVRIRPINSRELAYEGAADVVSVHDNDLIIRTQLNGNITISKDHIFQYDRIFWSCEESDPLYSTQEDVYVAIGKPLLSNAFQGYNACLFAYGQTGSGKSFSMMGKNSGEIVDIDSEKFSGIIPRFCRDLFKQISDLSKSYAVTVEVSYFEIYNEKIHDLLTNSASRMKTPLKVREHPEFGPYVVDLSIHLVKSYQELKSWLLIGNNNKATAATTINETSSRSHSIFSIELCLSTGCNDSGGRRSRVSLVDLAGSERLGNLNSNEEKIREGVCINKSLLTLGKVISALADQKNNQFVPYRDSVLTWLLRESLGGNSLTSMLATISPASTHLDETLATLRYACQARTIVNRARINENPYDRLICELKSEVERLKALRLDYQCHSTPFSSTTPVNDKSKEIDELKNKLMETESKLYDAQKVWEQRFMQTKENQMKELTKAEKYQAELESKVRVMKTVDNGVNLSPYKTNFLEQLEGVLAKGDSGLCGNDILDSLKMWCCKNELICTFNMDSLIITDPRRNKYSFLLLNKLNLSSFENIKDIVNNLMWTDVKKPAKQLNKTEVMTSMNQVYQALINLQPSDSETKLSILFAKVNEALLSFEAALLNNIKNNSNKKSVTFKL